MGLSEHSKLSVGAIALTVGLVAVWLWVGAWRMHAAHILQTAIVETELVLPEFESVEQGSVSGAETFPPREVAPWSVEVEPTDLVVETNSTDRLASKEELSAILPEWMLEQGELFHETREVFGHRISRCRGRYGWPNGSSVEVELSDAGPLASATVMMALGFNLAQTNRIDLTGYTLSDDEAGKLINQEYDFADRSGSFQIIVEGRYLVEIKLQNLPAESFRHVADHQLSLDQLHDMMVR
ncbi:hypothetical protein [Pontiella sp.]|uniref:hypothetical protein n=1 Tax=Pontiella sp. TaxID=2837462 RepID=UPI0035636E8B